MKSYLELLRDIIENGEEKGDRTSVGTLSVFGRQLKFDLKKGFPAVTTKKLAWKAVVGELLWFIEGSGNERRLAEITHGTKEGVVTIWTPNALAPDWKPKAMSEGDLGKIIKKDFLKSSSVSLFVNNPFMIKKFLEMSRYFPEKSAH